MEPSVQYGCTDTGIKARNIPENWATYSGRTRKMKMVQERSEF